MGHVSVFPDHKIIGIHSEWIHPDWTALSLQDTESGRVRLRAISMANSAAALAEELQATRIAVPSTDTTSASPTGDKRQPNNQDGSWPPSWTKSWENIEMNLRTFAGKNFTKIRQ